MTESILYVDDNRAALDLFARLFQAEYRVVTATCATEGLDIVRNSGPFAVVVSDYDMPDQRGGEFLARVRDIAPDTVTMLVTGVVEVDVAVEALHVGRIFRFLEKPCPREILSAALRDGVAEHARRRAEHARAEQLAFTRECLENFNGVLEGRVDQQARTLLRINQLLNELNGCDTLDQVAQVVGRACGEACGDVSVHVELSRGEGDEACVWQHGEPSSPLCSRSIRDGFGTMGAIAVGCDEEQLTTLERGALESIVASAATSSRNVIRRMERDSAQQATILALAKLAEQRDNETGKHLERVSAFCRLIAQGLREDGWFKRELTDEWIEMLARSAPLHDIGKVGIPDHILLKPGKLTPAEWDVMKRHAQIGADTLRSVLSRDSHQPFLEMSLDIAWCHHEKWDGSGYPRGLRGEQTPLSARIVALADVYDALTSDRPYKRAWSHSDALAWILTGSGSHFDPRLVDVLMARGERADEIRTRLADTESELHALASRGAAVLSASAHGA